MSIPVDLDNLVDALAHYRFAYLLTVTDKGTPHAMQVNAVLQGSDLVLSNFGRRTRGNVLARPAVSLLWPPESPADYSLIIDGEAALDGDSLRLTPTRAVLHRPGSPSPAQASKGCRSDCVELSLAPQSQAHPPSA